MYVKNFCNLMVCRVGFSFSFARGFYWLSAHLTIRLRNGYTKKKTKRKTHNINTIQFSHFYLRKKHFLSTFIFIGINISSTYIQMKRKKMFLFFLYVIWLYIFAFFFITTNHHASHSNLNHRVFSFNILNSLVFIRQFAYHLKLNKK